MGRFRKDQPYVFVLVGAILVIFLFHAFSSKSRIKILNVFRFPLKVISGTYYTLRDFPRFQELVSENKILKENVDTLEKEVLKLQETRLENRRLRKLLGFIESRKRKVTPAMVIARDPLSSRESIIIDKGKKHGVEKDMAVISGNGFVGRVRETGWSISRVLLITDQNSVVSGVVRRTRDEGAVVGNTRSGLVMKYLPLGSNVKKGDKVITSGFGSVSEKGILIGDVMDVEVDPSTLYKNAIIQPEVDVVRMEEVLVIR